MPPNEPLKTYYHVRKGLHEKKKYNHHKIDHLAGLMLICTISSYGPFNSPSCTPIKSVKGHQTDGPNQQINYSQVKFAANP